NGLDFYVIMTLVPKIWEADLCHRDGAAQIGAARRVIGVHGLAHDYNGCTAAAPVKSEKEK
ncbi:unnamed protein product, partial [Durusdinium trenchii]